ncbi:unnamed protein product [Linum tenue]|uniref:PH domain-containing protein n=1 Tax=Linum tenue TaxID=586396 RepID=A0AAV0M321_9ROSI|nr:unnamed protein product [Linum tenue]
MCSFMDDRRGKLNIIPDHFQVSTSGEDTPQAETNPVFQPRVDNLARPQSLSWSPRKLKTAASMLRMFSLRGLPWTPDGQQKVQVTVAELESLRSELVEVEEREAYLKAQLEHVDEILRTARLSGYLYIRSRWAALPGEPAVIDDIDIDDWLPRFVVLHGQCLFFYLLSTDLSPQDSTLLADVVEVGSLPEVRREDDEIRYSFYVLTRQGLRFECSSASKLQAETWLEALKTDCKYGCGESVNDSSETNNHSETD